MTTIQIDVSDELIKRLGTEALTERLQQVVAWEELSEKAKTINAVLQEAGLDNDQLMKEAKKRAWEKYKYTIKDKLPPEAFD